MSSGGRIFIVMLVLAFGATGLYYLATTRDAEPDQVHTMRTHAARNEVQKR